MRNHWLLAVLITAAPALPVDAGKVVIEGIDPRIELAELAFSAHLNNNLQGEITPLVSRYHAEVRRYTHPLRDKPGIVAGRIFSHSKTLGTPEERFKARADILLQHSPPPELKPLTPNPYEKTYGAPQAFWSRWIADLRSFAKDADYMRFFKKNVRPFSPHIQTFKKRMEKENYIRHLEVYTGIRFNGNYKILFSPMLEAHKQGEGTTVQIRFPNKKWLIYTVFSTLLFENLKKEGIPEDVPIAVWHETGHALLDDLYFEHQKTIDQKRTTKVRPDEWSEYIRDIIIEAVAIRMFARAMGEAEGRRQLNFEEEPERIYLRPLIEELRLFEKNRSSYKSLAEFYPELISALPNP